ncbi:MAG TPA: acyltransferase family protein [Acidimicrobiales bacterium]|nr:acyltransferase family protein [Acidimicrobiales bacterium]
MTETTTPGRRVRRGPPAHRQRRRPGYRPDIEGLRAVAVVAVVAYHAHVGFLSGGYVGVDVFYVISGFLITDLLWRELDRDGRISLREFYARRARRLLPAAMLVLVVTVVASLAWLPPLEVQTVWKDGLACALYVGNYRFTLEQTNYLAASPSASPFLHYWSLGVEEQFYLVWPLLLIGALLWRRHRPGRGASPRRRAAGALALLCVVSFGLSLWLTRADEPVAFFSLPTRAWELGLGGLLALGAPGLRRALGRAPVAAAAIGWAGAAAIVAGCLAFGPSTPFPGTAALLPVLGAGAVIAGGLAAGAGGPVALLGTAPFRAGGRISYSWYLWHYPVLILAPYALGRVVPEWGDVALAVGSGLLAALTYRLVERPVRSAPRLTRSPARSLRAGLALSGAGILACGAVALAVPGVAGHGRAPVAAIHAPSPSRVVPPAAGTRTVDRPTTPPTTVAPAVAAARSAAAQVEAALAGAVRTRMVPANLDPPLSSAAASEPPPDYAGCLLGFTQVAEPTCLFGDATGTRSIVLFGDSHAAMWFPAVDRYARAHHERLYVWTKAACPPVDIPLFSPDLGRTDTECAAWRAGVVARIAALHPTMVILGIAPNYDAAYGVVQDGPAWNRGLQQAIRAVEASGATPVVMGSIPSPPDDIPACLSAHPDAVARCDFPRIGHRISGGGLDGNDQPGLGAEARAVRAAGGHYVDVESWFCGASSCPVVVDNLLVYRDNSHITVPWATYLAPLVDDELALAVSR